MFEYYGDINVYWPGVGAYEPMVHFLSESLIVSPNAHFLQDFQVVLNDILKVFPIQMHWRPMP